MLRVGLTGGIGSGKSTVARILETLGVPVYYADDAAKELMNTDEALMQSVIGLFGPSAYINGQLDRKFISSVVFNDQSKLEALNALVHPATIRHSEEWYSRLHVPYAIREAALIFESGASENLDFVIGVYAPRILRIQRVQQRDGLPAAEIQKRMDRQINEEIKMKLCDFVIRNDEQELLIPQVLKIHERLLKEEKN